MGLQEHDQVLRQVVNLGIIYIRYSGLWCITTWICVQDKMQEVE